MQNRRFRIYDATNSQPQPPNTQNVTTTLGAILPAIQDVVANGGAWLDDFADDEVTVSSDFYELIVAYQRYRRAS